MGLRHAAALALILVAPATVEPKPTFEQALALTRAYLAVWQGTLASLVAEEAYSQEVRPYRSRAVDRRQLRSEVLLLRAPADNVWLAFRDVIAVDGKPVHNRQKRFDALFSGPVALMMSTAERIAEEGARHNLGSVQRTINTPIAALIVLHPDYQANTTWELDTDERLEGMPVWELRFNQRKPPFAVKVPANVEYGTSGRFRLQPETGRIIEWDLRVQAGNSTFRVKTRYGPVPSIQEGWVPLRLEDRYEVPRLERLRGVATYSNHRLFRTGGRVIGPVF